MHAVDLDHGSRLDLALSSKEVLRGCRRPNYPNWEFG